MLLFLSTLLLLLPAFAVVAITNVTISSEIAKALVGLLSTFIPKVSFIADPTFMMRNKISKESPYDLVKDTSNKCQQLMLENYVRKTIN